MAKRKCFTFVSERLRAFQMTSEVVLLSFPAHRQCSFMPSIQAPSKEASGCLETKELF